MMWFAVLLLFGTSFWETKAPADWSENELRQLLTDSPWAQLVSGPGRVPAPAIQMYIATAGPIQQAEIERERRIKKRKRADDDFPPDHRLWMDDNRATQVVLAVRIDQNLGFFDNKETTRMENESVMRVGRKKVKMTGYFPPSAGDPYLRLAFPKQVGPSNKTVSFDLYLPGIESPFRTVEFQLKDMLVNGKLEI
jgi:hypothetical protein